MKLSLALTLSYQSPTLAVITTQESAAMPINRI